jgi:hypothetical protein
VCAAFGNKATLLRRTRRQSVATCCSAMIDGSSWRHFVVERGGSDERYADWLGTLWIAC